MDFTAVILAAGEGTRMKSNTPKVLHKVCGIPMLGHVVSAARGAGAKRIVVVVGRGSDEVKRAFEGEEVEFVLQAEQKGTGHALKQAQEAVKGEAAILVLYGDMPLVKSETLRAMADFHWKNGATATVMTARVKDPTGYGRIIRKGLEVLAIREEKDATPEEKAIDEINSGIYFFQAEKVFDALNQVNNNNKQGEYYLTDVIEILNAGKEKVLAYEVQDPDEVQGVNDRFQLSVAQAIMQRRIIHRLMAQGVTFLSPETCVVDAGVKIGRDTVIYPGVFLEGDTWIGEGCTIIGTSRIIDSRIGNGVEITMCHIQESVVEDGVKIGPFANLRPGSHVMAGAKIGDFVEVKNSRVGEGSKIPHLAYVGDAEIGRRVNIGAGVIFVNYDGFEKHRTVVEDDAFIGCNSNLIAPVTIGAGSYVAAGSTINMDVEKGALAIARERQVNKPEWVEKRRRKREGGDKTDGKQA
ncbi:bifunctional UDP-N-acetylglucosamine diphosphorylase/glucosamine-1-phosphate N-acetyltransferase GlmU [Thermosediminibacter oceani]|uniref:Bifunctional protein GlmU n=1 Tax=Thermosediminibacter oceani (strain ATCC BAA-1034 / DSM 16646 / JW/IW-1228P) TaxID=555079 RepID=D9RZE7_THEOJ|nr:bifunctional UDP-N-acetylglucosamine diphosphorylase/glucosamine-1-phosphate N-acetyltransferase GlmU [Thermosediminibacter oceani]ADL06845.1 glucosamine-1-phosphate N-acetyltransferase; UDP-N-acetylglucosamine pyrophosphorylase [Thermosediminibacter oceani DSM 16646]